MRFHYEWIPMAALLLGACAHVTNVPLCGGKGASSDTGCDYDSSAQTTYRFSPKAHKSTLMMVTLSGGGARAAALAFGTLQMLDRLDPVPGNDADSTASLLDQVDIISSVSGGSLMAGWYAVRGKAALATAGGDTRLWDFLNKDWMPELYWEGLNPWSLARYAFSSYERNDVLADFYARHFFADETYATILQKYKTDPHQPYVILNATDLGHETVFPFTQGRFDLLCSDLNRYRIADAVAASSNFPLAFSPLGLQNYSGCPVQRRDSWRLNGPPQWIDHYDKFEDIETPGPLSIQLNQLRAARTAKDLLTSSDSADRDKYVHLLDGGVTDNLGIRSTLALEDDPARVPSLYLRLSGSYRPAGYENIEKVLYVVVNARTRDPAGIDSSERPSGELKTAVRMADTQLDSSTLTDQDYLTAELESMAYGTREDATHATKAGGQSCNNPGVFLSCKPEAQANLPAPSHRLRFYVVAVDFDMIPYKACRDTAWKLKTNWGLAGHQAQDIADLAAVILRESTDLKKFYADIKIQPAALQDGKSFQQVCASLEAHTH